MFVAAEGDKALEERKLASQQVDAKNFKDKVGNIYQRLLVQLQELDLAEKKAKQPKGED